MKVKVWLLLGIIGWSTIAAANPIAEAHPEDGSLVATNREECVDHNSRYRLSRNERYLLEHLPWDIDLDTLYLVMVEESGCYRNHAHGNGVGLFQIVTKGPATDCFGWDKNWDRTDGHKNILAAWVLSGNNPNCYEQWYGWGHWSVCDEWEHKTIPAGDISCR